MRGNTLWGIWGLGLGAGLMYLGDPRSGRRRRARLLDKSTHYTHETSEAMAKASKDLVQRTRGFYLRRRSLHSDEPVDDATLEARVRSSMGRVCSHPGAIEVYAREGHVELRGAILKAEHPRVLACVHKVPGVHGVTDSLDVHAEPGTHPGLQGHGRRASSGMGLMQQNWPPADRLVVGAGSLAAIAYGLGRRGLSGTWISGVGSLLALRAFTNLDFRRLLGVGAGRRAIDFHKDIFVAAPVEEVFAFFNAFENFPRFMSHVREIRRHEGDRYLWKVDGPAHTTIEWEAEVTRRIPNSVLAWKSLPGALVKNAGIIHFEPIGDTGTRLDIRLSYNPPAGAVGHFFAKLFGVDPKKQMDDDLLRFKSLLERGKATGRKETVYRDELSLPNMEKPQLPH